MSSIAATCKEAFRRNKVPAIILQAFAGAMLALYALVPGLRPGFDVISEFKAQTDPWFGILTTCVFGGIIPYMVSFHRGKIPAGMAWAHLLSMILYWGFCGAVVDLLYTTQDRIFGSGTDLVTLATKTFWDQGPFTMIWGVPTCITFYGWKGSNFNWNHFRKTHPRPVWIRTYWTVLISTWIVWIPGVIIIYAMPPGLQHPLFNLVICFFSILLLFLNRVEE